VNVAIPILNTNIVNYQIAIEINLPRGRVIELFDNPDNLPKWQPGLVSVEPLSGTPGQIGAKSRLKYKMGSREVEMVETITERNLPDVFSGTYEAKGVWNEVINRFEEISPAKTRWVSDVTFKFSGMMKLMAAATPSAFKKETLKFMKNFKDFAENADSET